MSRKRDFKNLDFINAVARSPGSTTQQIGDKVGCDRRTALVRLKDMKSSKMVIGEKRGPVWFWYSNSEYTYEDYVNDNLLEIIRG